MLHDYEAGIKVDLEHLAEGVWKMIQDHPDRDCMRYGMFPKDIMDVMESTLKERIPDLYMDRTTLEIANGKEVRAQILHDVCMGVLMRATEEKFCIA